MDFTRIVARGALALLGVLLACGCQRGPPRLHLGPTAWTKAQWLDHCQGVRTSFNPDRELSDDQLTLVPGDPRWLDFVYWAIANKVAEHQVEAFGGTGWEGPKTGVIFHWAPGSHWERDTVLSFGLTLGHTQGEHRWTDTMFPELFERHGGVYGMNLKDRLAELDPASSKPWVEFLEHTGGAQSPLYRYVFHREAVVDPAARKIHFSAGQGVAFSYGYERYLHELQQVLTDCRAVDFLQQYDRQGPGFAAQGNWARQSMPADALERTGFVGPQGPQPGVAEPTRYRARVEPVPVPPDLPEADAMARGQKVYAEQCEMCHGVAGDGAGFLAEGLDVKPRDFRAGTYKYRSTASGELPAIEDVERAVRLGVPGTTMPAWGQFLTAEQLHDVSRYLVVFSDRFVQAWRKGEKPQRLAAPTPPAGSREQVAHGESLWGALACAQCHGAQGRGDGPAAAGLEDQWGNPAPSTDLTWKWSFRNGHLPQDLYRTVVGGLDGSPMPSYADALPREEDRWALVAYLGSLSPKERPALRLGEFAKGRRERLDEKGRVRPAPEATGGAGAQGR